MPKSRGKKKRDRDQYPPDSLSPDEGDSESVCSSQDGSVLSEDGVRGEETTTEEDLQFVLSEHVDNLSDKSSRTRLAALSSLTKILCQKIVGHHLVESKETLVDTLVRGVRKLRGGERCELLQLASLLAVQFGVEHPELLAAMKLPLLQLGQDPTASSAERAAGLSALGLCAFIQGSDDLETEGAMRELEAVFRCRLDPVVAAAIHSWSLLLSITPSSRASSLQASLLPVLNELLSKGDMNVRIAVGQAIALLFELAEGSATDGDDTHLLETTEGAASYDLIQQLATESNRYTGRKERNTQRSCFRDILSTLDDGSVPDREVRFGVELLVLDSWAKLIQYNTFREVLGSGMKAHIQGNDLLRDIFQLGPTPTVTVDTKATRLEKKYYNAVVAKHRTQSRAKQRDKKTVL